MLWLFLLARLTDVCLSVNIEAREI